MVVTLSGELDVYRAAAVRDAFSTLRGDAVIDLTGVTYLDSTVLNELVRLRKRLDRGITLVVSDPQIRHILALVGFGQIFTIVESLD